MTWALLPPATGSSALRLASWWWMGEAIRYVIYCIEDAPQGSTEVTVFSSTASDQHHVHSPLSPTPHTYPSQSHTTATLWVHLSTLKPRKWSHRFPPPHSGGRERDVSLDCNQVLAALCSILGGGACLEDERKIFVIIIIS